MADIYGTSHNYTFISAVARLVRRTVDKGHFTTYVFKEDEIAHCSSKVDKSCNQKPEDLLLNVKVSEGICCCYVQKNRI